MVICGLANKMTQPVLLFIQTVHLITAIVHFKITLPHPLCLHVHSGLLCGQCAEGLSLMLGFNQCGQCTNDYIGLIIPFALAGIALVVLVTALA